MHTIKNSYLLDQQHDSIDLARLANYHKVNYGLQYDISHVSEKSITIKVNVSEGVIISTKRIERIVKEVFNHLTTKMIQVAISKPLIIDNTCAI